MRVWILHATINLDIMMTQISIAAWHVTVFWSAFHKSMACHTLINAAMDTMAGMFQSLLESNLNADTL